MTPFLFEILKEGAVITVPNKEGFPFDDITLEAQFLDDDGNVLLQGPYTVSFVVGDQIIGNAVIDENGDVKFNWLVNFISQEIIETYPIIVSFSENPYYLSAESQGAFTLKSAKWLKQDVISELEKAKTGDKRIDQKINRIIKHIQNSLDDELWLDVSHLVFLKKDCFDPQILKLNPDEMNFEELFNLDSNNFEPKLKNIFKGKCFRPKLGLRVFYEEYITTKLILEELRGKPRIPEELKNVFTQVIGKLIKTDTLIAKIAIYDAKIALIQNPKFQKIVEQQIKKAEEELAKVEKELAKNKPDKAIIRLSKAWLHAQLAIKFANLEKL